jgi:septum formation protein
MQIILASGSPRRREILSALGLSFEIITSDADESTDERDPAAFVEILSRRKGEAVRDRLAREGRDLSDTLIISSDTVVAIDGEILGKPADREEACAMLRRYSGRSHRVVSGVCLIKGDTVAVSHEETLVDFDEMSEEQIADYVDRFPPYDKAGAYAIQGAASAYIKGIRGDYFNVVGLPVHRMCRLYFEKFGKNLI